MKRVLITGFVLLVIYGGAKDIASKIPDNLFDTSIDKTITTTANDGSEYSMRIQKDNEGNITVSDSAGNTATTIVTDNKEKKKEQEEFENSVQIEMEDHASELTTDDKEKISKMAYNLTQLDIGNYDNKDDWEESLLNIQRQYGMTYVDNYVRDLFGKHYNKEYYNKYDLNNPSLLDQAIIQLEYLPDPSTMFYDIGRTYAEARAEYDSYTEFYENLERERLLIVRKYFIKWFEKEYGITWLQFEIQHSVKKPVTANDFNNL